MILDLNELKEQPTDEDISNEDIFIKGPQNARYRYVCAEMPNNKLKWFRKSCDDASKWMLLNFDPLRATEDL